MDEADHTFAYEYRVLAGIRGKTDSIVYPEYVVIDLTNRCNSSCIACWTHSPLLGEKQPSSEWHSRQLPFTRVIALIDELALLGTREIRLTGGGEPFLHPNAVEIIQHIKSKKLACAVTTNGTRLDESLIDRLAEIGLDILTVSIWAGDAETYVRTHPRSSRKTFERIAQLLHHLKSKPHPKPGLVIANVLSSMNFDNVDLMIDFALDVGAFQTYFTLVDPIEGATDQLLLDEMQRAYVYERLCSYEERFRHADYFSVDCLDIIKRRLCAMTSATGEYDRDVVNTIPCYAGWIFARIMANGDVSPCCRGVHFGTGNILDRSFRDIWNGSKYRTFRRMALHGDKLSPAFEKMGCGKTCDNFHQNLWLHHLRESGNPSRKGPLQKTDNNATERLHAQNAKM